jgi:tRNA 2-selenouridine synthase
VQLHGHKTIERWNDAARAGKFDTLVDELLARHYDPSYSKSLLGNFPRSAHAATFTPRAIDDASWDALSAEILATLEPNAPSPTSTAVIPTEASP